MMKKILLVVSILFVGSNFLSAQSTEVKIMELKRIRGQDGIDSLTYKGKPFNGLAVDYYENDSLKMKIAVVEGKANGIAETYWNDGTLRRRANFLKGVQNH